MDSSNGSDEVAPKKKFEFFIISYSIHSPSFGLPNSQDLELLRDLC